MHDIVDSVKILVRDRLVEQVEHVPHEDGAGLLGFQRFLQDLLRQKELHLIEIRHGVFQPITKSLVDGGGVAIGAAGRNLGAECASWPGFQFHRQLVGINSSGADRVPGSSAICAACLGPVGPLDAGLVHASTSVFSCMKSRKAVAQTGQRWASSTSSQPFGSSTGTGQPACVAVTMSSCFRSQRSHFRMTLTLPPPLPSNQTKSANRFAARSLGSSTPHPGSSPPPVPHRSLSAAISELAMERCRCPRTGQTPFRPPSCTARRPCPPNRIASGKDASPALPRTALRSRSASARH